MSVYFDTSALVPIYVPEPLTERALRRVTDNPDIIVSRLTEVEFYSALARKLRMGDMQRPHTLQVADTFTRHLSSGIYTTLQVTNEMFTIARDFLQRLNTSLRTLDALHLSCCVSLQATLVTADVTLAETAAHFAIDYELLSP